MTDPVVASMTAVARDAGVTAWVHSTRLRGPMDSVAFGADQPVPVASLYKLPLALVWADLVARGELDPRQPMLIPSAGRLAGPTGVAVLTDDVTLSARDAVRLMLTVSDNALGDALLDVIGLDRARAHLEASGLTPTLIRQGSTGETTALMRETGAPSWGAAQQVLADVGRAIDTSQYDPALSSSATAQDLTAVLRQLWAHAGDTHALVRAAMASQVWRHRIGSGFPHDDVVVHGKTGTLGRLRHEVAVIQYPWEHPVAVAVLTKAARPERHLPRVDAAIGELARLAVAPLRMAADEPSPIFDRPAGTDPSTNP